MSHDDVVLVGVDGSPASLEAADWAAAYARAHGRSVHLVCAYSVPSFTAAALLPYEQPHRIVWVDRIPRTALGKCQRLLLAREVALQAGADR